MTSPTWVCPDTYVEGFHDLEVIKKMQYRSVAHLGLVSVLSFGASGLGGMHTAGQGTGLLDAGDLQKECNSVWWQEDPESDVARAREVLLVYLKAGGNLIDTAHWYGQGKSERLLGRVLQDIPRKAYYITTKVGRYDKDPHNMFDFSYDRTLQAVQDSLKRLKLEYVDVVQVHDPEYVPDVTENGESNIIVHHTIKALHAAKGKGWTKNVGLTGYPIETQNALILQCKEAGLPIDTSLTYCRYTMNDRSLLESKYWKTCAELGIGVINASPIAMGLLMNRDPPGWHPCPAEKKLVCKKATDYCIERGVDISKLAIHFVLRETSIATTLVSTTSVERCAQNMAAVTDTLSAVEEEVLAHIMKTIFEPEGNMQWENIEVTEYWKTIDKAESLKRYA